MLFRNSEFISSLLGRSVTNEKFITINLEKDSVFRSLRIATFRKSIADFNNINLIKTNDVIEAIDSSNKKENINLIIINIPDNQTIGADLEDYLINLNKKVLLISTNKVEFNTFFISRSEIVSGYYLTYFNNDIQRIKIYFEKNSRHHCKHPVTSYIISCNYIYILLYRFLRWISLSYKTKQGWASWQSIQYV